MILKRKETGTISPLTTSSLVTFSSTLPEPLTWLHPELCHHQYLSFFPNPSFKPATLSNHHSYSSRRFFSRNPTAKLFDLLMTLKPLSHYPLANCPLAFLLFSSTLDSLAHHYNHPLANTLHSWLFSVCHPCLEKH